MSPPQSPKRILIAPLDWGLGHATRCIPIIHELRKRNTDVFIASSGHALAVLKAEFSDLVFFEITSYSVHYSRRLPFMVSMFFQLPKFINTVIQEKREIKKITADNKIDVIISDNRFGCRVKAITSVFITHQVNILMPSWLQWIAPLVNYFNHQQIKKFDECWVPDEAQNRITGILSEACGLKVNYIGMLSRFDMRGETNKKYDLLVLLSGPEPQRTMMEEKIRVQLPRLNKRVLVVRGLPGKAVNDITVAENCIVQNYLHAKQLNQAIEESELIISRSGYSSIMDLAKLKKKAIFIPTAGQTEQEYLAKMLLDSGIAYSVTLDKLNISEAMKLSSGFSGFDKPITSHLMTQAIDELLNRRNEGD